MTSIGGSGAVNTGIEVWGSESWRASAVSWLDDRLADTGAERTGEVEQPHLRPWATVLMAPTTRGTVWLKAAGPGTVFEIGLYDLLGRTVPDRVLQPVAIDHSRGWMILPDGGAPVGERRHGAGLVDATAVALQQYGQLQRDLTPFVDDLLALGVADMRPAVMPERFDEALDAVAGYVARCGDAAERAAFDRVPRLRETFVSWCDQLAATPASSSVDHNDLHAWNIFVSGQGPTTRCRFYDWGDSVVAHPFASMLIGLGFMQYHLGVSEDDRQILRLRDAYLEVFSDLAPRAELVATLELACRVGKVARALTWHRAVRELGDSDASEFASAPLRCLQSLLDSSYLGGA